MSPGDASRLLPTLGSWNCFGCDPDHPKGLRLRFTAPGPDRLRSEFVLTEDYTGVASIVHGGIIATVFDDVMMWCLLRHRRRFFVTLHMSQQLLLPAPAGVRLRAEALIDAEDGHRVVLKTTLSTASAPDEPLARGSGTFVPLPSRLRDLIPEDHRTDMEALFDEFAADDGGEGTHEDQRTP